MARTILTEIALFFTPFALYFIALWLTKRGPRDRENWPAKVVLSLAGVGIVLMAISLLFFSHYGGYRPGGTYVPAYIDRDGKFHPGETK